MKRLIKKRPAAGPSIDDDLEDLDDDLDKPVHLAPSPAAKHVPSKRAAKEEEDEEDYVDEEESEEDDDEDDLDYGSSRKKSAKKVRPSVCPSGRRADVGVRSCWGREGARDGKHA